MLLAALVGALAVAAPAGAATTPKLKAKPHLFPAFKPSEHDYVSRCVAGRPLKLRVSAPSGGSVSVGGHRHHGTFRLRRKLKAGQRVVLVSRRKGRSATYSVRCLPRKFPTWTAKRFRRAQAAYYLIDPSPGRFVVMVDPNGSPIWWERRPTTLFDAKVLPNGHLFWSRYFNGDILGFRSSQAYEEHTITGKRVRVLKTVGSPTDFHDAQRLPNGNTLMISYKPRKHVDLRPYGGPADAEVLDGVVQEITRAGKVKWSWSSKDHIGIREQGPSLAPPVELGKNGRKVYDLVHLNSVDLHDGNRLLISLRATNAVYDIDRSTGNVVWKLGGTPTPKSLTPTGDAHPGMLFGGQHDARVLPDGTVGLHDNESGLGRSPRAVRFRIDEAGGTATELESLSDPTVPLSNFAGSARKLAGGNWVAWWGGTRTMSELTPAGKVVFRLQLHEGFFSYRVFPVTKGTFSARTLRRAMDKMSR